MRGDVVGCRVSFHWFWNEKIDDTKSVRNGIFLLNGEDSLNRSMSLLKHLAGTRLYRLANIEDAVRFSPVRVTKWFLTKKCLLEIIF